MPDVSRVVYDAALTRVRGVARCSGDPCPCPCICKSYTLAALGLDEPPTEACVCMGGTADCVPPFGSSGGCSKSDDVPPTEIPKACPTCGDCPPSGICNGRCMQ